MNDVGQQTVRGRDWSSQALARVTATLFRLSRITDDCIALDYNLNLIPISPLLPLFLCGTRPINENRVPCVTRTSVCAAWKRSRGARGAWSTRRHGSRA